MDKDPLITTLLELTNELLKKRNVLREWELDFISRCRFKMQSNAGLSRKQMSHVVVILNRQGLIPSDALEGMLVAIEKRFMVRG